MSSSFETFGFPVAYQVEVEPEFPGSGAWGCPLFGFGRTGGLVDGFESRWGTPMVLAFGDGQDRHWVGTFAAGGLGGIRGVFACPSPTACCVVVDGPAYAVEAFVPEAGAQIVHDQVIRVVPVAGLPLLLLVRFIDMVALGPDGIAWSTSRMVVDDLRVERASADAIVCSGDHLEGTAHIELDPETGRQTAGTRLDTFWPPDAIS